MSRDNEVILLWVPAHLGIAGNEEADRLAKKAAGGRTREVPEVIRWKTTLSHLSRRAAESRSRATTQWASFHVRPERRFLPYALIFLSIFALYPCRTRDWVAVRNLRTTALATTRSYTHPHIPLRPQGYIANTDARCPRVGGPGPAKYSVGVRVAGLASARWPASPQTSTAPNTIQRSLPPTSPHLPPPPPRLSSHHFLRNNRLNGTGVQGGFGGGGETVTIEFKVMGSAPVLNKDTYRIKAPQRFEDVAAFLRAQLGLSSFSPSASTLPPPATQQSLYLYINFTFDPALDENVGNLWRVWRSLTVLSSWGAGYSVLC